MLFKGKVIWEDQICRGCSRLPFKPKSYVHKAKGGGETIEEDTIPVVLPKK